MKDNPSNNQQFDSSKKLHEIKDNLESPKISKNNTFNFTISSPDKDTINQKFFPSKENFFGTKFSPLNTNQRSFSPKAHSPILNYYIGLSPPSYEYNNYYSPKKDSIGKVNKNNSKKLSPNFNASPSDFFNKVNTNNNKNGKDNEEDTKTLQEKMEKFVKTENSHNLNIINISDNENNEIDDEDNDESNDDENYILSFHEDSRLEIEKDKKKYKNYYYMDENNKDNNKQDLNNDNLNINLNKNEISNKEIPSSNDNSVKNIINKSEYTPYIPNIFRNMPNDNNFLNNYVSDSNNINKNFNNNYYPLNINYNYQNYNNINIPQNIINFNNNDMNFTENSNNMNIIDNYNNQSQNFYYNGDNYQISTKKDYKKNDYIKTGKIPSITPEDVVTTITANNKVIKRINPNVYLNESVEYLAYNIFPLSQDQAGCRYLQETIEKNPEENSKIFFKALIPYLIPIIKDPFGNYFVQKLFPYLNSEELKILLENVAHDIYDLGSNNHGTRVIQNLIGFIKTRELADLFLKIIKPFIISLLKEMHGTHIINKFLFKYPEYINDINKIILNNCCSLATHKHGCCFLQKILENPDNPIKDELIKNLIENCVVLIIDQYGNYVIQSILFLSDNKYTSSIVLILAENAGYYSKHKYSSNVIEKCFDFCGKKEKNILIEKLSKPEIISELILDEHGNYVIQKALYYADYEKKEEILNCIKPLIPKIKNTSFGDKLLNRLYSMHPKLINRNYKEERNYNKHQNNWNNKTYYGKNNKSYFDNDMNGFQKKNNFNNNYMNSFNNNIDNNNVDDINNRLELNNSINNNNIQDISNNNVSLSNYYNINNNTFNFNINSNKEENENNHLNSINSNNNFIREEKNFNEKEINNNISHEPEKKKKKKKGKRKKTNSTNSNEINSGNVSKSFNNENID